MAKLTGAEGSFMRKETTMKVIGVMIKFMVMEFSRPRMEVDMKDTGLTIIKMDKVKKLGLMAQYMRGSM